MMARRNEPGFGSDRYENPGDIRQRFNRAVANWLSSISMAAQAFEQRWTMLALQNADADLAERLREQRDLFVEAYVTGELEDVETQGAATVRGYAAAIAALESQDIPDDSYQVGRDPYTGTVVAIGAQKAAMIRAREIHGDKIIHITPDEIAVLFGKIEALRTIGQVRQRFPGTEIVDNSGSQSHVTSEIDGDPKALREKKF
jgi:hypothetical protein